MAADLLETIKTWRSIYTSISTPDHSSNSKDQVFHDKWMLGMLKVVGSLGVIEEIKNTPVEKHMKKAVDDGRSRDISRLDDIYVLLGEVERYIGDRMPA